MTIYKMTSCPCQPGCTKLIEKQVGVQCDICKDEAAEYTNSGLYRDKGVSYPWGNGYAEKLRMDICPDCFDKHILGLLESLGVEIKWDEYDY